jgi:hypothetical protein
MAWLPESFEPPVRVDFPTGHHLRPLREDDVDIDYPAVMGSRDSLWEKFGAAWGWPRADLSYEKDRADLARHERETGTREAITYAIVVADESQLVGCCYVDPPEATDADADARIAWWLIDEYRDSNLERFLTDFMPQWIASAWPFAAPVFGP